FGSHGCVRLDEADAQMLYEWASIGTAVEVN
ncbi:MAG TPA: L,D-transpeptidase, partial [Telluria sp.]